MCGGSVTQFKIPRQLTPINGEPLIERTVRLLKELGIDDIAISTNNDNDYFDYLISFIANVKEALNSHGYSSGAGNRSGR